MFEMQLSCKLWKIAVLISNCGSNMCDCPSLTQLRIDFLDFILSEPDPTGFCVNDNLAVTGGASSVPLICGENTSEHGKTSVRVFICPQ
jgi:hypothetical protein